MAAYLRRIRELAVKVETTKGTFLAPNTTGTESLFLLHDAKLAFEFESHDRPIMAADLSTFQHLIGKLPVRMTFGIEARASAAAGTADAWGSLFLGCGFGVANTPATSDVYTPSSLHSTHKCLSMYAYLGSSGTATIRVGMRGMMGNVRSVSEIGKPTMWEFDFLGAYEAHSTAGTVNVIAHESAQPPVFLAPTFTWNSSARTISRFAWDMNNEVVLRDDANDAEGIAHAVIVNRDPSWELDPEWEATGTEDWITQFTAGTQRAIAHNIGSKLAISIPKAQISSLDDAERNGLATVDLKGKMHRSAVGTGDTEISITKT